MNVKAFWKKYGMEERMKEKKGSFSGSIGFVLAAAGSAVGVGNIWLIQKEQWELQKILIPLFVKGSR